MRTSGVKLIRNQNIKRNYFNSDSVAYIDEVFANSNKSKKVKHGDVVAVRTGSNIGEACVVPKDFDGALTFTTLIARPNPELLDSFYLSTHINSERGISEVNRLCAGGGKPNLNSGELKRYRLLTPPLPEQKKIAQILSTWDKAITITEQLLANSQQQKMALMQQLLTGKKRLFDKNGVRFSGGWKHGHLSDLGKITKGKALSSKDLIDGDYPVIAGGKSSPYNHRDYTHENVITVSASGAYAGYVAYHPYKLWASDCSVVMGKSNSNIGFIYQLMSHMQSKIYSLQSGGAQPHVYPKDLEVLRVSIPPVDEQQKIAAVLSSADQEIFALQQKLAALKQEKKALMQQLLTGKRRVTVGEAA
ncbi:type I restriction modification DNA specificity domain protein [Vibrio cholerae HC-43B1]|nr:type I restriction modification DNA specificity domain protein [Vibrio cholerae HC-43B1]